MRPNIAMASPLYRERRHREMYVLFYCLCLPVQDAGRSAVCLISLVALLDFLAIAEGVCSRQLYKVVITARINVIYRVIIAALCGTLGGVGVVNS